MKQKLYRRLTELECISKARARANPPDVGVSARQRIQQYLDTTGIEQGPMESLAETFARALGITCQELRQRLRAGSVEAGFMLTETLSRAMNVLTKAGQHDAIGNQIHAPTDGSGGRFAVRRVAGDLGILDKASLIVPGDGGESER